jgi:hypothetical protein
LLLAPQAQADDPKSYRRAPSQPILKIDTSIYRMSPV